MAATGTPTPNIGLRRAQGTDPASVDDINYNSALIDTKLGAVGNSSVQDQIDTLNSNITNLVKEIHYELPENVTIATNDYYSKSFADVGLPNGAKVLFGYVDGYAIQNANGLIISESTWYSAHYINICNVYKNSCTLTQGTIVRVYYRMI